jgi:hypothetical protein
VRDLRSVAAAVHQHFNDSGFAGKGLPLQVLEIGALVHGKDDTLGRRMAGENPPPAPRFVAAVR